MPEQIVFYNGQFLPESEVRISPLDRGFLFADSLYEVIKVYDGRPWRMGAHLDRLFSGGRAVNLEIPLSEEEFAGICYELIEHNQDGPESMIYIQVTRGSNNPRKHACPTLYEPNVLIFTKEVQKRDGKLLPATAITAPDNRHGLCHIKTTALVANCLANTRAQQAGAFEAVFVRDGLVTEGTHTNVFCVIDGVIYTHPLANILPGITRREVLDIVKERELPLCEQAISIDVVREADEIFTTGTMSEITPIVKLDGKAVGKGQPGPVTKRIHEEFQRRIRK